MVPEPVPENLVPPSRPRARPRGAASGIVAGVARAPVTSLHAKVIVVADQEAWPTTRRLARRAMADNLECGTLLHGGPR